MKWKIFFGENKSKKDTTPATSVDIDLEAEEEYDTDMVRKGDSSKANLTS